jgi:hypothetical protein
MSRSAPTEIDIGRFYTPQPVQRKFHSSEARYPLLEGGRGGGKSTALLWEATTEKYIRWLQLTSRPPTADIVFTIPRRRWIPGRRW